MLHLMKYELKQMSREWSVLFWALAFPIILGTFFYISFGSGDMGEDMESIPVAVVEKDTSSENARAFHTFLENMDEDTIVVHTMKEEKARKEVKADKVDGIYYVDEEPSLAVGKSGINQSILKSILDTYNKNAQMMITIAESHPENMARAVEAMSDWSDTTEEVSVGGRTMNPNVTYFFALIAYACLCGAFLGLKGICDVQANLSALGARRCITPTHKLKLVISELLVLFGIEYVNILVLTLYVRFVLRIDLGADVGSILLVNLLGSLIGVSMGILIGCIGKLGFGVKMGLTVTLTVFPGFLAGLMFGNMKNIIEQNCPVVNRINPAAVLSDAYYCMAVYNDSQRMSRNLVILGCMSAAFVLIAFLAIRRERYDSI